MRVIVFVLREQKKSRRGKTVSAAWLDDRMSSRLALEHNFSDTVGPLSRAALSRVDEE